MERCQPDVDSNHGNHRSAIAFVLDWYQGHKAQGRDFGIKIIGNMVTFIPNGLKTGCKKRTM